MINALLITSGICTVLSLVIGFYIVTCSFDDYRNGSRTTETMKDMKFGWLIILSPFAVLFVPTFILFYMSKAIWSLLKAIGRGIAYAWKCFWIMWTAMRDNEVDDSKMSPTEAKIAARAADERHYW